MNAPLGGHLWDQLSVHLQGGVHLLESLIKGVNIDRPGQTLGVHFTEVSRGVQRCPLRELSCLCTGYRLWLQ